MMMTLITLKENTTNLGITDFLTVARSWLNVRWKRCGRNREGVDCGGLILGIAKEMGFSLKDPLIEHDQSQSSSNLKDLTLKNFCDENLILLPKDNLVAGMIGLFSYKNFPQHLGIIDHCPDRNELTLIHAYAPARKVVEHHFDQEWQKRLFTVYVLKDIAFLS